MAMKLKKEGLFSPFQVNESMRDDHSLACTQSILSDAVQHVYTFSQRARVE
jgi:hypothetical protein